MITTILGVLLKIYEEIKKPETAAEKALAIEMELLESLNDFLERVKFGGNS